jgi:hypothetical protein
MNIRAVLRILALSVASFALAATPQLAFARGAGHVGGGFHGGGFGGFHGASVGAFRGGYGGFRGGYGGFRGYGSYGGRGYWGYPGWGWGLNVGLGFGYWGYPYWYGPWGPYAYSYSYYPYYACDPYYDRDCGYPPDYRYQDEQRDRSPAGNQPNAQPGNVQPNSAPPKPSAAPATQGYSNNLTTNFAEYRSPASNERSRATSNYRLASYTRDPLPGNLRPAVRNVIEALRAMPPAARQRQLNSGRYDGFSPEEREAVSQFAQTQ